MCYPAVNPIGAFVDEPLLKERFRFALMIAGKIKLVPGVDQRLSLPML